jgi:N-acetylmuramate 1-kinase
MADGTAERGARIAEFLAEAGWAGAERRKLAGDASFRRYDRLRQDGKSAVLMDAPPPQEDVRPFIAIAETLCGLGFSAPVLLARDVELGALLLEDLGDDTYTALLRNSADEAALYALAVDLLIALHRRFDPAAAAPEPFFQLPPYDEARLLAEATLLTDWFLPAITSAPVAASVREGYVEAWRAVFPVAEGAPATLVLRDFHVDNLMLLQDRPGVAACGLLDFQDAVLGPASYDLVSLLEDARRDVPAALVSAMIERYLAAFPALDRDSFLASYAVLGAQRNAKIIGIFTRLDRRDGKPHYLGHIPRVWRLLEADLRHPALAPVASWFAAHVPAELHRAPPPGTKPVSAPSHIQEREEALR